MPPYIISPLQMLRRGLRMVNIEDFKQHRRLEKTNVADFKSNFGRHPIHLCRQWRDLQTTTIPEANMSEEEARHKHGLRGFLMAHHFLFSYDTLKNRAAHFQGEDKYLVDRLTWRFVFRLEALKPDKIVWPTWDNGEVFVGSLDGTCTRNQEPRDPAERVNARNFCKKFNMAGRNHEIVIDLWSSRCVHAKISDRGSVHDLTAFRQELVNKVVPGQRLICDRGYTSFQNDEHLILSFPNPLDEQTPGLVAFKAEARARQENYNKRLKDYDCLDDTFIHSMQKQQACFAAVVCTLQYAIEDTGPYGEVLNSL